MRHSEIKLDYYQETLRNFAVEESKPVTSYLRKFAWLLLAVSIFQHATITLEDRPRLDRERGRRDVAFYDGA